MHVCTRVCTRVYTCVYVCVRVCEHACIHVCARVRVCARAYQVDGPLEEGGGLEDLVHGDGLQLVGVQLLALEGHPVVHHHGQRPQPRLRVVAPPLLGDRGRTQRRWVSFRPTCFT